MASRGTEALLCVNEKKEERVFRRNRGPIKSWDSPVWVNNIMFEDIPDFDNIQDVHSGIMSLSGQGRIVCVPVRWISSNGKIIKLNELYPECKKLRVVFVRNRNALRLVVIPSKTKCEILSTGLDMDNRYRFPLLLNIQKQRYEQVNLF